VPRHATLILCSFIAATGAVWAQAKPPATPLPAASVRVRDLTRIQSVRGNQLVGYGLVVGLNGTGDSQQSAFTLQSVVSMLQRFGITLEARQLRTKNVAAVIVSAEVPAFYKNGSKLDVTVASLGDSTSLQGGILLQTPLLGADEEVYAAAQGAISIGGFSAGGGGNAVTKNHPTTGRVPGGALIEREIPAPLAGADGALHVNLADPDFENATRIAAAINERLGAGLASAEDAATVRVRPPAEFDGNVVGLIAAIGAVPVQPATPARVVLNERTGTVIIGAGVRIAPVAVAHGSLTVEIQTEMQVSQPGPLSDKAETVVVPQTGVHATESRASVMEFQSGTTMAELVRALNALRVTPRDIIAIIQAIKSAGALFAELEMQ
jgi:flagellar P-ring protein FlgI